MTGKQRNKSGALFKFTGRISGWSTSHLREVSIEPESYFFKIDGENSQTRKPEQVQIFLAERDAAELCVLLKKRLMTSEIGKKTLNFYEVMHNDSESLRSERAP